MKSFNGYSLIHSPSGQLTQEQLIDHILQLVNTAGTSTTIYTTTGSGTTIATGSLTAGIANAFTFAWQNPYSYDLQITEVTIYITTAGGTAGSLLDVGSAASATTHSANLINDGSLNAVGYLRSVAWQKLDAREGATDWLTGQILTANASSLVGKYYISYRAV